MTMTTNSKDSARTATPPAPAVAPSRRRPALIGVAAVTLLAAAAYGAYWALTLRHHESTDNAYVQAPVVQITPQVGGTVLAVLADDTDIVKQGTPLVRLDPSDAKLALERAEAQLAQTVREVRTLYVNNSALAATVRAREAEVMRLEAEVARAADDVARRRPLLASGAVGGEEMKHAETTLTSAKSQLAGAQSALAAAREQAASNRALTEGTAVEKHPSVERAAAAVREAARAAAHRAARAGERPVAKRTVQVGQRVAAGSPLMTVIPLEQVWVEANFKEVQLRQMRIGQPVKLTADLYGSKVEYDGRIAGLGAGTGAAFALLPAQNATGNWIKVVQRVPVRVELDAKQLAEHPLRVGLSMEASVDVGRQDGAPLLSSAVSRSNATQAMALPGEEADKIVREIIVANLGKARS
ncbi:HlyD family efflux transporter periplasmic adaptor subunit [Piscinibacter aquaticus]|uniref:HlyD family efflux transporter periplasmic adaptor subunit n=1 Tax=Piscinibacter aquaticus TaxID=392597 RepID=A0A5C6U209_9BURK|nr:HlyD family efflux transporter periplasmic adaptor subunit [Piscinibacter aquaticus]